MVTLGPPTGPFLMGFVAYHLGYRWIYWIYAIVSPSLHPEQKTNLTANQINGGQFIGYFFFGPETRYIRQGVQHTGSAFKQEYLTFRRLDPTPLRWSEFIQPASLAKYKSILVPTLSYTFVFAFASVLVTVEIPQIFVPKFGFNPQQLGLQFLGLIVGSVIGEQLGGPLSDVVMNRKTRANGGGAAARPPPEHRLWLSYAGFLLTIVGLIVFGFRTQQAPPMHWDVSPIIGIAIGAVGNQIVTTVLVTYAVDCHPEASSSIGVFVNMVRSTVGQNSLFLLRFRC